MKASNAVYIILIVLVIILIGGVVVFSLTQQAAPSVIPEAAAADRENPSISMNLNSLVKEEETISSEIIEDGLRDMGKLITQEYYFTEVTDYTSVKKFLNANLPWTQSSYIISYDGTITAGIDFTAIEVAIDDIYGVINVTLPKSEIISTEIEPDSFQLYSEKESIWNKVSVEDFNSTISELTENARDKALDKGLLEKADSNAKTVISNFIISLIGSNEYRIEYSVK